MLNLLLQNDKINKITKLISIIILCGLFIGYLVPNINFLGSIALGPDDSWREYLAYANTAGLKFGRNIIFTYGIFNQVSTHQYSSHFYIFLSMFLFLQIIYIFIVLDCLGLYKSVIYFILTLVIIPHYFSFPDEIFILIITLITYWIIFLNQNRLLHLAIIISIAIIANIKFTYLIAIFLPLTALLYKKNILSVLILIVLFFMLWVLSQGSIVDFPNYLKFSWQIADGYNNAMQRLSFNPYDYKNFLGWSAIIIYLLSGLIAYGISGSRMVVLWIYAAGFFMYKESIVRSGEHLSYMAIFNLNILLFLVFRYVKCNKYGKYLLFLSCILSLIIIYFTFGGLYSRDWSFHKNYTVVKDIDRNNRQIVKQIYNFPELSGCSDIYPWDLTALISSGNKTCVRPVFQSYSTYTPSLLQLNAKHLLSNNGPEHIFWTVAPIENRYATEDDSLSWPIIIANYSLSGQVVTKFDYYKKEDYYTLTNNYVLLNRISKESSNYYIQPILTKHNIDLAEKIVLSENKLYWVRIDIQPTLLEKIIALIYKPNQINLHVIYEDGSQKQYQLPMKIAEAGFILSPSIKSLDDFIHLYLTNGYITDSLWQNKRVKSFFIDVPEGKLRSMYKINSITLSEVIFKNKLKYKYDIFAPLVLKTPIQKNDVVNIKLNSYLDQYYPVANNFIFVSGWSFADSYAASDFRKFLVYRSKKQSYWYKLNLTYMPGVTIYFKTKLNQDLAGFTGWVNKSYLPAGTYDIYLYMQDNSGHIGKTLIRKNIVINTSK